MRCALLSLAPQTAHRLADNGALEEVPVSTIQPGGRLQIRPGEKIPVAGLLETGTGDVDESMLTCEANPRSKQVGDPRIGATLNLDAVLVMRAQKTGADTLLAQIIQLVAQAQRSQAPMQRLTDRIAGHFVVGVAVCAGLTFYMGS